MDHIIAELELFGFVLPDSVIPTEYKWGLWYQKQVVEHDYVITFLRILWDVITYFHSIINSIADIVSSLAPL